MATFHWQGQDSRRTASQQIWNDAEKNMTWKKRVFEAEKAVRPLEHAYTSALQRETSLCVRTRVQKTSSKENGGAGNWVAGPRSSHCPWRPPWCFLQGFKYKLPDGYICHESPEFHPFTSNFPSILRVPPLWLNCIWPSWIRFFGMNPGT